MRQFGGKRLAREQGNLNSCAPICLELIWAFVDFQVAPEDGPSALANSGQPVFILRAESGFA
jgi:hypothetical protein